LVGLIAGMTTLARRQHIRRRRAIRALA